MRNHFFCIKHFKDRIFFEFSGEASPHSHSVRENKVDCLEVFYLARITVKHSVRQYFYCTVAPVRENRGVFERIITLLIKKERIAYAKSTWN